MMYSNNRKKNVTVDYAAGLKFLGEYASHFEALENYELEKLRLLHLHKIEEISAGLSDEQAFIMKTNVLETKRQAVFGRLNLDEIVAASPADLKTEYERLRKRIKNSVNQIREINDIIAVSANERLKHIHRVTKELEVYNDRGGVQTKYKNTNPDFKV